MRPCRKLLWAVLLLGLCLTAIEVACRVAECSEPENTDPFALQSFASMQEMLAHHDALARRIRSIPPPPPFAARVRDRPANPAKPREVRARAQHFTARSLPGTGPRVLLVGGSAAWGFGLSHDDSPAHRLEQRLLAMGAAPTLRVINLAGLGSELNTVAHVVRTAVSQLPRPPAAVVIFSGNNEFMRAKPRVGVYPWEHSALYRRLVTEVRAKGWLRRSPGDDPAFMFNLPYRHIDDEVILSRVWVPSRALPDARFWPALRRVYLDHYLRATGELVAWLQARGVFVVLVPPPANLHFFPGYAQNQPLTTRHVGRAGYRALHRELNRSLVALAAGDEGPLRRLVSSAPDGPLQLYALAQHLEAGGRHREAYPLYIRAQDVKMGALSALPTMGRLLRAMARPGVAVVRTDDFYDPDRPVRARSQELFVDSCHPTARGADLLAARVAVALAPVLRGTNDSSNSHGR